jgi:hypothetical protein
MDLGCVGQAPRIQKVLTISEIRASLFLLGRIEMDIRPKNSALESPAFFAPMYPCESAARWYELVCLSGASLIRTNA